MEHGLMTRFVTDVRAFDTVNSRPVQRPRTPANAFRKVTAKVEQRGKRFVHRVYGFDGEEVGKRESEHRYAFAICKRLRGGEVLVDRFSGSDRCTSSFFAVRIEDA
jgi:hypothetical protein